MRTLDKSHHPRSEGHSRAPTPTSSTHQSVDRGLVVPAGTYLVNETVPLASDVHITSNGAVLRKTAAQSVYAWFTSVSGSQQGYGSGARNVRVDGLTFQADY